MNPAVVRAEAKRVEVDAAQTYKSTNHQRASDPGYETFASMPYTRRADMLIHRTQGWFMLNQMSRGRAVSLSS